MVEDKIPPLLQAAHLGSIDSVEWFMSDTPLRRYKEFAEVNKHDKRIKTLESSGKGFDKSIGKWLNVKSKLLLQNWDIADIFQTNWCFIVLFCMDPIQTLLLLF